MVPVITLHISAVAREDQSMIMDRLPADDDQEHGTVRVRQAEQIVHSVVGIIPLVP
jgi:hypothetical protein